MLNIGTKAPEFALKDQNNEIHHLKIIPVVVHFRLKDIQR